MEKVGSHHLVGRRLQVRRRITGPEQFGLESQTQILSLTVKGDLTIHNSSSRGSVAFI